MQEKYTTVELVNSIKTQDYKKFSRLLKQKDEHGYPVVDIDKEENSTCPIIEAVKLKSTLFTKQLINARVHLGKTDANKNTLLDIASLENTKFLMSLKRPEIKAQFEQTDANKNTPLINAVNAENVYKALLLAFGGAYPDYFIKNVASDKIKENIGLLVKNFEISPKKKREFAALQSIVNRLDDACIINIWIEFGIYPSRALRCDLTFDQMCRLQQNGRMPKFDKNLCGGRVGAMLNLLGKYYIPWWNKRKRIKDKYHFYYETIPAPWVYALNKDQYLIFMSAYAPYKRGRYPVWIENIGEAQQRQYVNKTLFEWTIKSDSYKKFRNRLVSEDKYGYSNVSSPGMENALLCHAVALQDTRFTKDLVNAYTKLNIIDKNCNTLLHNASTENTEFLLSLKLLDIKKQLNFKNTLGKTPSEKALLENNILKAAALINVQIGSGPTSIGSSGLKLIYAKIKPELMKLVNNKKYFRALREVVGFLTDDEIVNAWTEAGIYSARRLERDLTLDEIKRLYINYRLVPKSAVVNVDKITSADDMLTLIGNYYVPWFAKWRVGRYLLKKYYNEIAEPKDAVWINSLNDGQRDKILQAFRSRLQKK